MEQALIQGLWQVGNLATMGLVLAIAVAILFLRKSPELRLLFTSLLLVWCLNLALDIVGSLTTWQDVPLFAASKWALSRSAHCAAISYFVWQLFRHTPAETPLDSPGHAHE